MRCVALGPIDAERRHAAELLVALQDAQLAAMKPGAAARDVDAILRNGVLAAGLRESYPNVTGYTLGYYSRVPIRSSDFTRCFLQSAEWRLEAGMVFHMYTSARGVSFSETVLVGDQGAERLTKLDRRLFSKS
jgi:Xaa-Pro dipeptidase